MPLKDTLERLRETRAARIVVVYTATAWGIFEVLDKTVRTFGWPEAIPRGFLILLLAWVLKISSAKLQLGAGQGEFAYSFRESLSNAALGPLPGWLVLVAVVAFYGLLLYAISRPSKGAGELAYGDVHV